MSSVPGRRFPTRAVLFLFFLSVYLLGMSGWIQYGDEVEKYSVAQSIVERHDISIRPTEMRNQTGEGGRSYSAYELGQTLLEVPLYALGKAVYNFFPQPDVNSITLLFVGLLNPIATALACLVLFETAQILGIAYPVSLGLTLVYGLATIAWTYTKGFTREPLLTLFLLLSLYGALRFSKTGAGRWALLAGVAAGYLTFTKFIQAMVVPFLAIYIAVSVYERAKEQGWRTRTWIAHAVRVLALFFSPFLLFLVVQSIYAFLRFGTPWGGIAGTPQNPLAWIWFIASQSHPVTALAGVLFSPEKSIFLYSPPVLLGVLAWFRWVRRSPKEAWLVLSLVLIELASVLARFDWNGGSWWGPRYLVQITPLLILPLGAGLESLAGTARKLGIAALALLALLGGLVQIVGVASSDRDYMDAAGRWISLLGQIDYVRHGVMESLVVYLSPQGRALHLNPFGPVVLAIAIALGIGILWAMARDRSGERRPVLRGGALTLAVLVVEFAAFLLWVVRPYSDVLAAKADSKVAAGDAFLADGRRCEAAAMYLMALDRGTTFRDTARDRVEQLLPHAAGASFTVDELRHEVELAGQAAIRSEERIALVNGASLDISIPAGRDGTATAISEAVEVLPNTRYQLFGWMQTENVYGSGYAAITIYEDDGAWKQGRDTPVVNMDETRGWRPFWKEWTTLPTTRRLYIKTGLWQTYGTAWVDGVELGRIADTEPTGPHAICPQMN